jgi:polysaccharide export outer membrane protein
MTSIFNRRGVTTMSMRTLTPFLVAALLQASAVPAIARQSTAPQASSSVLDSGRHVNGDRNRTTRSSSDQAAERLSPSDTFSASEESAIQSQINSVYQSFYSSYRLGPGDVIGIYIEKHPEDSVEKVTVSPVGRVYFPLLGDIPVVGRTLPQLQESLLIAVAEYIKDPKLTLALLEAHSAKVGVLGDVRAPGMMVMTKPLRLLDVITLAGGISDTGSSNVSILRHYEDGRVQILRADMKKILKGKASPEENLYLRAGDTVIVHGNMFKTLGKISSVVGLASFAAFMAQGGN